MQNAMSQTRNLSGKWQFKLDPKNVGVKDRWFSKKLLGTISLPGTTDEAGYGEKTKGSEKGTLTRVHTYVGPAWYRREITIPVSWKGCTELFLERVLWKTTIWVDAREVGSHDSLATPHTFDLGTLEVGKHVITIRIDNSLIYNIGDKGHSYGDHMQTVWNGVVGRIELRPVPDASMQTLQAYPDVKTGEVKSIITLAAKAKKGTTIVQTLRFDKAIVGESTTVVKAGSKSVTASVKTKAVKAWSDDAPNLYELETTLSTPTGKQTRSEEIGFRTFTQDGTHFVLNGTPVYLRGNLDNCHFPLTGYPNMDVAGWERILGALKAHGLNHVRFHSWCPPKAAFIAGDRLGMILQPEAGIWIDGWMKDRTQFKPDGLGHGPKDVDRYVQNEIRRILDAYGNHPSFCMFCIGNELGSSDFKVMAKWIASAKKYDPRRLYSCSTARRLTAVDDYIATHNLRGSTRGIRGGRTNWDFNSTTAKATVPVIAHELGQWPIYPLWEEIDKYTGTLRARNYEIFRDQAKAAGVYDQTRDFQKASGKFNQLLYKYEIESALRTSTMAGFHLLGLQDYSGQGEALIGILDSFYDSKGVIKPERMTRYCDDVVPLLRTPKFTWSNDETFKVHISVANYGKEELTDAVLTWTFADDKGTVLKSGKSVPKTIACGKVPIVVTLEFPLSFVTRAMAITLTASLDGTDDANDWNLWVYPKEKPMAVPTHVIVSKTLDAPTVAALKGGKRVVLLPTVNKLTKAKSMNFTPVYWSSGWFPGQARKGLGLLVQDTHPALKNFPSSFHSDWQWERVVGKASAIILPATSTALKPIVQVVPDFHKSEKFGPLFEVAVGKGRLLVCGFDIERYLDRRPVARQLRKSLLTYAASAAFTPKATMTVKQLTTMFPNVKTAKGVPAPKGFETAIFHVRAATNTKPNRKALAWKPALDDVSISKGCNYTLKTDGVWRDGDRTAWFGKKIRLEITCPQGVIGDLMIHLHDWNDNGRTGIVSLEGRDVTVGSHSGKGVWLKLHVMREDTLDKKIVVEFTCMNGPNLHVREVALIAEQ